MRTHCTNGHELSPENTYLHYKQRKCRKCNRLRYRAPRVEAALQFALEALDDVGQDAAINVIKAILAGDKRLVP